MNSSPSNSKHLSEYCNPVFVEMAKLRMMDKAPDLVSVREQVERSLSEFDFSARAAGFQSADVEAGKFALVASIDEIISAGNWPGKEDWKPLAAAYFNSYSAGEEFFQRISDLRRQAKEKAQVIEVYYLCLCTGFKGTYVLYGEEKRKQLIQSLFENIAPQGNAAGIELSPHGVRPEKGKGRDRGLPAWGIALGGACFCLIAFFVFKLVLASRASETVRTIQSLMR